MPEMETKFPDFTGKLTEFAVNKLMVMGYNFVNFFFSVLLLSVFLLTHIPAWSNWFGFGFFFSFCKVPI